MDEDKIQQHRREQDEKSTMQRAAILGLQYLDTRDIEQQLPLVEGLMTVPDMYKGYMVPLVVGGGAEPYRFGVTSQTPQSLIHSTAKQYNDRGDMIQFSLISGSAFKAFMLRHDPPKQVIYDDIKIAQEGDSDTISEVSKTLNSVSSDMVFDYLIDQADRLNASDIHIENERSAIRIRMRIDGALHPVASLYRDRYRIIMGELASSANISSAATEPQSGHMQKEVTAGGATHLLNLRVETVPTMYGQDAVLRLFNFDESLLQLDLLGIPEKQRREIDEIISHPRGMVLMV
ncbi:MAG: ATPase, T2SS/T4P/T4SS family, partial [Candidatus Saccharimonadales bacterium]